MQTCQRCSRTEDQVKLVDAVSGGEVIKICEECASMEMIPIVRRPTSYQLEESVRPFTVRQRLARMAGVKLKEEAVPEVSRRFPASSNSKELTLDRLRPSKDYSKIIEEKQALAKKSNVPLNLVDNYNWHIQMARRNRKMTLLQLSTILGESEMILKLVEQGSLPDDANRIISKIEQFFQINLRKSESLEEKERISSSIERKIPARILNFDKNAFKDITISDLKRMKDDRLKAEQDEKEFAEKLAWGKKQREENEQDSVSGSDVEIFDE